MYNIHKRINTDIVRDMAAKDPQRKIANFGCHGVPEPEASVTGKHRSNLKRKAKGIARSPSEVFAYLRKCGSTYITRRPEPV